MKNDSDLVRIGNSCGWTSTILNPTSERFVSFLAARPDCSAIDVGTGYGVAALPALRTGAVVVINDIEQTHLDHVIALAQKEGLAERCRSLLAKLPNLPALGPLDAIHASNVLHFLRGEEIMRAAAWMYRSLKPDGRVFLQTLSPFAGHNRGFRTLYEARKRQGFRWAGEIEDAKMHFDERVREMTPDFMHVLEKDTLSHAFRESGFLVEYCDYYSRPGLPSVAQLDGRENLGLVASKA